MEPLRGSALSLRDWKMGIWSGVRYEGCRVKSYRKVRCFTTPPGALTITTMRWWLSSDRREREHGLVVCATFQLAIGTGRGVTTPHTGRVPDRSNIRHVRRRAMRGISRVNAVAIIIIRTGVRTYKQMSSDAGQKKRLASLCYRASCKDLA